MPAKRILLVEDEPDVRSLVSHTLMSEGYSVDAAETLAQARTFLRGAYDLVISDVRLPDGNGLEILNSAADAGVKTLVISGYLFMISEKDLERHDFLMKPARPAELLEMVARIIGPARESAAAN